MWVLRVHGDYYLFFSGTLQTRKEMENTLRSCVKQEHDDGYLVPLNENIQSNTVSSKAVSLDSYIPVPLSYQGPIYTLRLCLFR